jgi:hypothetical protein
MQVILEDPVVAVQMEASVGKAMQAHILQQKELVAVQALMLPRVHLMVVVVVVLRLMV